MTGTGEGCVFGHAPEEIEVRPSGARVCVRCRQTYLTKSSRIAQSRKSQT